MSNRKRVVELTRSGHSLSQIAMILGITRRSVERFRQLEGLTEGYVPPPEVTEEEVERARLLLEDGASYKEVGRTLGRCYHTIQRRLPGYEWSEEQRREFMSVRRRFAGVL